MLNIKELSDVELAVLTYAVEQNQDSLEEEYGDPEYCEDYEKAKPIVDVSRDFLEKLQEEYQARGLNSDTWGM